jgi:pyruvate,water dikinase
MLVPLTDVAAATAERVGPKAATLARLKAAGLPVPDGFVLAVDAYRAHLAAAGFEPDARIDGDGDGGRRRALRRRLTCLRDPLDPAIADSLVAAWDALAGAAGALVAVRSSASLENAAHVSAAGQFETFLGIAGARDLLTAVRACWASVWSPRAMRYLEDRGLQSSGTAMAVLIQRLVPARASGGGLSRTPDGGMLLTGAWGLGPVVAQGEVVPDRFRLDPDGSVVATEPGIKERLVAVDAHDGLRVRPATADVVAMPCLSVLEAEEVGRLVRAAESTLGRPVEVEWALDGDGPQILQARPLRVEPRSASATVGHRHPGLTGQPSGVGWGAGPACLVRREGDLDRVAVGDVLITRVAGPALTVVLPRVAGVVAELGGSSSHLAALARERGIPAVLGVPGATRRIPEGAQVQVDGITGIVRWTR